MILYVISFLAKPKPVFGNDCAEYYEGKVGPVAI
jgi:hypothetical protein